MSNDDLSHPLTRERVRIETVMLELLNVVTAVTRSLVSGCGLKHGCHRDSEQRQVSPAHS